MTQLRKFWVKEMQNAQPEWVAVMRASKLKADFERAVQACDSALGGGMVRRWIECLNDGWPKDLRTMMHSYPQTDEMDETGHVRMWKEVDH